MATIGQALTSPEAGWKRYDNLDVRIIYSGGAWADIASASYYGGSSRQLQAVGAKIKFKFYGTKFRWVFLTASTCSAAANVKVDGQQVGVANLYSASTVFQALNFEVTGLALGEHIVEIENTTATYIGLDSVDIDDIGRLIHPVLTEKTSLFDMQVGDIISCDYVAGSGVVGTFSNLGAAQRSPIPKVSTATADGSFYFVMAGYDTQGRMKLVADRELQLISWNTLNMSGLVYGKEVQLGTGIKSVLRLLTGGLFAGDAENEWDIIIRKSTLGGRITAGDDAVWNYLTGSTTYLDATSTTHSSGATMRVARGTSLTYLDWKATTVGLGYRPVLLVELLNNPPAVEVSADREATYSDAIKITGSIMDSAEDSVAYRVTVNNGSAGPWSPSMPGPVAIDVTIPTSALSVGSNTIKVEATDGKSTSSKTLTAVRKSVDSTYVAAGVNKKGSKTLKAGAGSVAYVKVASPKAESGYIVGGSLTLNVLTGTGSVIVAPVLTPWDSSSLDASNPPVIASAMAVTLDITAAGVATLDIGELAKSLRDNSLSNGIAIYGTDEVTFDVLGIATAYTYQPTELYLPEKVYGNKVLLKWKPYILERPESVASVKLLRSSSADMAGSTTVFETSDLGITQYEDTSVTKGTFYYAVEVNYIDNAYSGLQLDFDLADEAGFIQQDAVNGTDFANGVVTLKKYSATVVVLTFTDSTGLTYDPAKVTVADGIIRLKPSS